MRLLQTPVHVPSAAGAEKRPVRVRFKIGYEHMKRGSGDMWRELQEAEGRLAQLRNIQKRLGIDKPRCGYTKHKDGQPCRVPLEPGQRHCKVHDVGAKTQEGKQRIREAQWRRWERWRQARDRAAVDSQSTRLDGHAEHESRA